VSWRSKASWFSGRRHPSRGVVGTKALVGPSSVVGIPPRQRRADDSGCPEGRRGGERRRACATKLMQPTQAREIVACARQTRPSLGPSTRACRSSLHTGRQKRLRGGAIAPASRLGKPTQVGGTNTGVGRSDAARLAARHRFRNGECVTRRRKERRSRPPSLRVSRVPVSLLARRVSVAEVCRRPPGLE